MLQLPEPSAVAVPNNVVPLVSYNFTVLLASAVPVKTGVLLLVMLSPLDVPLSLALVISGALGAVGAVVSTVTDNAVDAVDVLPAASVALAVMV